MYKKIILLLIISSIFLISSCVRTVGGAINKAVRYTFDSNKERTINISIKTDKKINLSPYNNTTQPLKVCIYVFKNKDWVPPGLYDGIPCSKVKTDDNLFYYEEIMVLANQIVNKKFKVIYKPEYDGDIFVYIAGNFQQISTGNSMVKKQFNAKRKSGTIKINTMIKNNSILSLDK